MKKLAFTLIAALAIFSVSCSKSDSKSDSANDTNTTETKVDTKSQGDPKSQIIALANETTAKIKANPADAEKIYMEASGQSEVITKGLTEQEVQALYNDAEVMAAMNELNAACNAAALSAQSNDDGSDDGSDAMTASPNIDMTEMSEM